MTFIFRRQKTKLFAKKITNTNKNREKRDEISLKNN